MTKTPEQRAYEAWARRNPEAPLWEDLCPDAIAKWRNVAAAAQSEWDRAHIDATARELEFLRARIAELNGEVADLRAKLATVANGFTAGVEYIDAAHAAESADVRDLVSAMLSEFSERADHVPGRVAIVGDDVYEGWLQRAGLVTS